MRRFPLLSTKNKVTGYVERHAARLSFSQPASAGLAGAGALESAHSLGERVPRRSWLVLGEHRRSFPNLGSRVTAEWAQAVRWKGKIIPLNQSRVFAGTFPALADPSSLPNPRSPGPPAELSPGIPRGGGWGGGKSINQNRFLNEWGKRVRPFHFSLESAFPRAHAQPSSDV